MVSSTVIAQRQTKVRKDLAQIKARINDYLMGQKLKDIEAHLAALDKGHVPFWLDELRTNRRPSKTDGKSLGTLIEKLLKAEIGRQLSITVTGSSASGVDIPECALNCKATSDQQPQSSEPFESPYQRVLGAHHDIVVCIYNGGAFLAGREPSVQLSSATYLSKTEVADKVLCMTAKVLQGQQHLLTSDEPLAQRVLRATVYAMKAGPRYSHFKAVKDALEGDALKNNDTVPLQGAIVDFEQQLFLDVEPALPSKREWTDFLTAPLDGKIGISFALQWRYQFKRI